jgi:hypothetical protein
LLQDFSNDAMDYQKSSLRWELLVNADEQFKLIRFLAWFSGRYCTEQGVPKAFADKD